MPTIVWTWSGLLLHFVLFLIYLVFSAPMLMAFLLDFLTPFVLTRVYFIIGLRHIAVFLESIVDLALFLLGLIPIDRNFLNPVNA